MQNYRNIHSYLSYTRGESDVTVKGDYIYYFYGCDGTNDQGWGCGYRTLQSICSWIKIQQNDSKDIPSIKDIQNALVKMGDKSQSFLGSRDWIGSFEVSICVDFFYDIPCKILHIRTGAELIEHLMVLQKHFHDFGSPVMMDSISLMDMECPTMREQCMKKRKVSSSRPSCVAFDSELYYITREKPQAQGGDTDNASKCILGVSGESKSLLILDPHCYDRNPTVEQIIETELVAWRKLDSFSETSFYNLCLPQLKGS